MQYRPIEQVKWCSTKYTNPSEASTMAFILSVGVVGVVSRIFNGGKQEKNELSNHSIISHH